MLGQGKRACSQERAYYQYAAPVSDKPQPLAAVQKKQRDKRDAEAKRLEHKRRGVCETLLRHDKRDAGEKPRKQRRELGPRFHRQARDEPRAAASSKHSVARLRQHGFVFAAHCVEGKHEVKNHARACLHRTSY